MGSVIAMIPARYASSRLPGKPLVEISGKPMIQHVYERTRAARRIDRVVVATDDERIMAMVAGFGGEAVMTSLEHVSGTDRIAAASRGIGGIDMIVNIQGDEPLIEPSVIDTLVEALEATDCECATPIGRITSARDLFDTNVVKVVVRKDFAPLYFSRSPIPCIRDLPPEEWVDAHPFYRHIGLYAYRPDALEKFVTAAATPLESCEQLEQLRMLDLGISMFCVETDYTGHAVDTPEDVMKVERIMRDL
ncbi:MAG: 3-deoxy-manno-octulosonate cytidylyltransferase [Chlorobi bacterium]|nr:3-deoxy-manno-octulosonate cytidylyltransferase [Chlorobiota bacterium]